MGMNCSKAMFMATLMVYYRALTWCQSLVLLIHNGADWVNKSAAIKHSGYHHNIIRVQYNEKCSTPSLLLLSC